MSLVISGMKDWHMSTSILSRKWLTWTLFLNLLMTQLLNVKYVFKANMFEHLSTLSQEIMNPSNLFTVMCVTRTEFSLEAVEDILWHSLMTTPNSITPIFPNPRMKLSLIHISEPTRQAERKASPQRFSGAPELSNMQFTMSISVLFFLQLHRWIKVCREQLPHE